MMGTKAQLFTPLPLVTLEQLVPADHFYRHLDRVFDLSFVHDLARDCYAGAIGRHDLRHHAGAHSCLATI